MEWRNACSMLTAIQVVGKVGQASSDVRTVALEGGGLAARCELSPERFV